MVDDNIEIDIKESDCRIDTYRASGAGGQHVNTTDSAVRITHLPTNIVVASQQERSQIKNRAIAWAMLKSRLYELELKKREEKASAEAASKTEIGWGHQIRSYVLQPYQLVKDLRTGTQSTDPQRRARRRHRRVHRGGPGPAHVRQSDAEPRSRISTEFELQPAIGDCMTRVPLLPSTALPPDLAETYETFARNYGPFRNQAAVLAHVPPALDHLSKLLMELKARQGIKWRYVELAIVVVSKLNACQYCVSHHEPSCMSKGLSPEAVERCRRRIIPSLDEIDRLVDRVFRARDARARPHPRRRVRAAAGSISPTPRSSS